MEYYNFVLTKYYFMLKFNNQKYNTIMLIIIYYYYTIFNIHLIDIYIFIKFNVIALYFCKYFKN